MITLRPYQDRAAAYLSTHRYALVKSAAGSGKTIIAAAALQKGLERRPRTEPLKVGWIANTLEQVSQGKAALALFEMNIDPIVCCVAGAQDMSDRDILIVDECQHAPSPSWAAIIESCPGGRWFFSATPFGDDEIKNDILRQMCANNVFEISRDEVKGYLSEARVIMLDDTDQSGEAIQAEINRQLSLKQYMLRFISEGELFARIGAQVCMDMGIVPNEKRNQAIIRTPAKHREDSTLILVGRVEHGQALARRIPGAVVCYSKMGDKRRRRAIVDFGEGKLRCMVATSLADEGLDVPRANVLIMAGAGRNANRMEQRSGRVLRAFADKSHGTIYDFTDTHHSLLRNQSLARVALYRKLGYKFPEEKQLEFQPVNGKKGPAIQAAAPK
jgi:superfamily II DNA or RNA helicase